MRYLILAYDGTDAEAPARRQAVRPQHLENAARLQAEGHLLIGGALLNDDGGMIGTAAVADFDSREELDEWLRTDPYAVGDVWRDVTVLPYRVAEHYLHLFKPD